MGEFLTGFLAGLILGLLLTLWQIRAQISELRAASRLLVSQNKQIDDLETRVDDLETRDVLRRQELADTDAALADANERYRRLNEKLKELVR